jgi:hypothetical protein
LLAGHRALQQVVGSMGRLLGRGLALDAGIGCAIARWRPAVASNASPLTRPALIAAGTGVERPE